MGRPVPKLSRGQQLLLILVTALLLRVPTLGSKSLWLDEAYSIYQGEREELAIPVFVEGPHPPLYYTILHHWLKLVGPGEVTARLPSVAASLAGIGLLYLLGRALFDHRVALLAAALLALSPLDIWYAQEARMHIFVTLFGLTYALALAWNHRLSVFVAAVALGIGLYVDYATVPLWVGLSALWFVAWRRQRRDILPAARWLAGTLGGWLLYRGWWPYLKQSLEGSIGHVVLFTRIREWLGLPSLSPIHFIVALLFAAIAITVGTELILRLLQEQRWREWITAAVWLGFVLVNVLMVTPRLFTVKRVLVTGWPYVILLVSWLVVSARGWHSWLQPLALGVASLATLGALILPKDNWRGATAFLESQSGLYPTVWLDPRWNTIPYEYYARSSAPETGSVEALAAIAAESREIWLVAERFPGLSVPSSPSEAWLDTNWILIERQPFYRLEVRGYRPR